MDESVIRQSLVDLLRKGQAHVSVARALEGVSPKVRGKRPAAGIHSVWEELEHLRIAQEDILRFTLDRAWRSPAWPEGYWPAEVKQVTDEMWQASVSGFNSDLDEVIAMVSNTAIDLTDRIPHGSGQTYLREVLLVADHNAYHLGQIVQARKLLGDWAEE